MIAWIVPTTFLLGVWLFSLVAKPTTFTGPKRGNGFVKSGVLDLMVVGVSGELSDHVLQQVFA